MTQTALSFCEQTTPRGWVKLGGRLEGWSFFVPLFFLDPDHKVGLNARVASLGVRTEIFIL